MEQMYSFQQFLDSSNGWLLFCTDTNKQSW